MRVLGDVIKLSSPSTHEFWQLPVLYEDDDLLALNKPAGLPGSPDAEAPTQANLIQLLHSGIAEGKPWAKQRGLSYLLHAHRLDAEASGVLLLAKNKAVLTKLTDLFGSEKPLRRYVALVQGQPVEYKFTTGAKLGLHPARANLLRVDPRHGKRSQTAFAVREKFRGWTLLDCEPLTDRPHQVRAHLKALGLPVVGDSLYGGRPLLLSRLKPEYRLKPGQTECPLIDHPALHAEELAFTHPVTGASLKIAAPWRKELEVGVKYLRRYAPS